MRAPPPSLMKTNGSPVWSAASIVSQTFFALASPTDPPATVKSWLTA